MQLKPLIRDTREKIYRTTSIIFLVQLFGALGAGFFFVVQNILGVEHMLGALEPANESILWFLLFWATDFYMIALCAVLCYLIAGLPGLAPGLSLAVYFAHFAGGTPIAGEEGYFTFFATPLGGGGGANIGYMGYFLMALFCGLLIKCLFAAWESIKISLGRQIDKLLKKIKQIPDTLTGNGILDNIDLIVLVLILPVASMALTFLFVRYGIQKPFGALAEVLPEALLNLSSSSVILAGLLIGVMVGFDITGPVSMSAFAAAVLAFAQGDARLLTIYGICFVTAGWIPFFMVMVFSNIFKKKGRVHTDTDDTNLAISGPINAFFENMKLTVAFTQPFAMRSPFTVIPGLMTGCGIAGLLAGLTGIVNGSYLSEPPKYGAGKTMQELLQRGEIYLSFTLPFRTGDWLSVRLPSILIIAAGGAVGGIVIYLLRALQVKNQKKRGTYVELNGDIVIEMRELAKKRLAQLKKPAK